MKLIIAVFFMLLLVFPAYSHTGEDNSYITGKNKLGRIINNHAFSDFSIWVKGMLSIERKPSEKKINNFKIRFNV